MLKKIILGLLLSSQCLAVGFMGAPFLPSAHKLSEFQSTTSAQLATVISDETGSGALVFGTSPSISSLTLTGGTTLPGGGSINSSGQLGLGGGPLGNTAGDFLDVNTSFNGVAGGVIRNSNTGSSATAELILNASGNSWGVSVGSSAKNSNRFSLYQDALNGGARTERIGVSTSGVMGIGYTSDQSRGVLELNGAVYISGINIKASNPTVSSCGTSPSIDSNSSNYAGTVTVGSVSATSCTITFASAFTTYNHCVITSQQSVAAFAYSYTLSDITVTATSMVSDKIDYHCEGY